MIPRVQCLSRSSLVELFSKFSFHSVFNKSIVPKIYENIQIKVSKKESDREKVLEFMKSLKNHKVIETLIMRPETLLADRYGKCKFSKNDKIERLN